METWLCCRARLTARPHQNPWIVFVTCPSKGSPEALRRCKDRGPLSDGPASIRIPAGHRWLSNHHRSSRSANSSPDPPQTFDLISVSSLDHRTLPDGCTRSHRCGRVLGDCARRARACAHAPACSPLQPRGGDSALR